MKTQTYTTHLSHNQPNHTHHKPEPGFTGRSPNPYRTTHTLDPSQDRRGYRETQTQTKAPHSSSKPSVHSPGTEAARVMQVSRLNVTQSRGVGLHPKACAALGLEAERAAPKHVGTQLPRTRRWHALGIRQEIR